MTVATNRIVAMDVLRGCAVMGILWMNITAFAQPSAAYFNPAAMGSLSIADKLTWLVGFVAVDGKMRGLFSLLFGASMLLVIDKAEMAGRNGRRVQMIRSAWLFLFGLAHYLLLWWGDILMVYAVVGLAALPLAGRQPIALVKWAFLAFLVHFLLVGSTAVVMMMWHSAAATPGATPALVQGYSDFMGGMSDPQSPAILAEKERYRDGFAAIVGYNISQYPVEWLRNLIFTSFDTLGFMLLGMAMLKSGFLTGRWDADQYRRTARHCFMVGTPPLVALGLYVMASDYPPLGTMGAVLAWSFPFRIPMVVGWAALILWLAGRHAAHSALARISAAGRLALTNYLGSSLLMTAIFYGWGMGLFGLFPPFSLLPFILTGWAIMLVWSASWTRRFATGPAEWLWRSLAAGKMQSIRKSE
ncbi:DUF418 domain-containing protein [Sphingobium sp. AN641]|uniref:DUF418 domain-containing protein n=1 Tax=Sphingobium sp. AN641 TaxID=3133443 RepID=UPI0030C21098